MSLMLMMRHHALLASAAKKGGQPSNIIYANYFDDYDSETMTFKAAVGSPDFIAGNPSTGKFHTKPISSGGVFNTGYAAANNDKSTNMQESPNSVFDKNSYKNSVFTIETFFRKTGSGNPERNLFKIKFPNGIEVYFWHDVYGSRIIFWIARTNESPESSIDDFELNQNDFSFVSPGKSAVLHGVSVTKYDNNTAGFKHFALVINPSTKRGVAFFNGIWIFKFKVSSAFFAGETTNCNTQWNNYNTSYSFGNNDALNMIVIRKGDFSCSDAIHFNVPTQKYTGQEQEKPAWNG